MGCVVESASSEQEQSGACASDNRLYVVTARHVFEPTKNPPAIKDRKQGKQGHYLCCDDDDDLEEDDDAVTKISDSSFGILDTYNDKAVDIALVPIEKHDEASIDGEESIPEVYTADSSELLEKEVEMLGATSDHRTGLVVETEYTMRIAGTSYKL